MNNEQNEITTRFPRIVMNLVMALIFWLISVFIPPTLKSVIIPGVNINADLLIWIITMVIMVIYLGKAVTDALVLGDIVTDIIINRIGIKEERTPKRAARDFVYIIIIILIVTAIYPILYNFEFGELLSKIFTYIAITLIVILIYDMGRILYKLVEQKAESFSKNLSRMAKRRKKVK